MKAMVELTDTFGGEANYSWCKRETFSIDGLSNSQIIRMARKLIGITGVKTVKYDYGDMVEWRFPNECIVAFLTFEY